MWGLEPKLFWLSLAEKLRFGSWYDLVPNVQEVQCRWMWTSGGRCKAQNLSWQKLLWSLGLAASLALCICEPSPLFAALQWALVHLTTKPSSSESVSVQTVVACGTYVQIDAVFCAFTLESKSSAAVAAQECSFEGVFAEVSTQLGEGSLSLFIFLEPLAGLHLKDADL